MSADPTSTPKTKESTQQAKPRNVDPAKVIESVNLLADDMHKLPALIYLATDEGHPDQTKCKTMLKDYYLTMEIIADDMRSICLGDDRSWQSLAYQAVEQRDFCMAKVDQLDKQIIEQQQQAYLNTYKVGVWMIIQTAVSFLSGFIFYHVINN